MTGEHEYRLDDKNRVLLPKDWQASFEDGLVVTRGLEGCLYLLPLAVWGRIEAELLRLPISDLKAQALVRFFVGAALKTRLDPQGRVTLPDTLMRFADILQAATLLGLKNRVELWAPRRWDAHLSTILEARHEMPEAVSEALRP